MWILTMKLRNAFGPEERFGVFHYYSSVASIQIFSQGKATRSNAKSGAETAGSDG